MNLSIKHIDRYIVTPHRISTPPPYLVLDIHMGLCIVTPFFVLNHSKFAKQNHLPFFFKDEFFELIVIRIHLMKKNVYFLRILNGLGCRFFDKTELVCRQIIDSLSKYWHHKNWYLVSKSIVGKYNFFLENPIN